MRTILVAVDDSPRAKLVIEAGVDVARRLGAKVRLLRAVGLPAELPAAGWPARPTEIVDESVERAKRDLAELAAAVPEGMLDGATAEVGVPWDAICACAKAHDVDLIVVGSHGYRFLDRIVGTTAAKVVNHADRSVLVVRDRGEHAARAA